MNQNVEPDRLAVRVRPQDSPMMDINGKALFLHWSVAPEVLRPLIPPTLEIETFEEKAWISLTPFSLTELRLLSLPPIPGLDSFLELNVRNMFGIKGRPALVLLTGSFQMHSRSLAVEIWPPEAV